MTYTVQPGDSLWGIALQFDVSAEELMAANPHLNDPDELPEGETVHIPPRYADNPPAETEEEVPEEDLGAPPANLNYQEEDYDYHPGHLPADPEAYPEVRVEGENPYYARILSEDYAGRVSELTAITQYLHHHFEMEYIAGWRDVAELEEKISIVEMHHLAKLGELLVLLGGRPRYEGSNKKPWTADYVAYHDFEPCAQLMADIKGEKAAIAQYRRHIWRIKDRYIRALLHRFIKDEECHVRLLSAKLKEHCRS